MALYSRRQDTRAIAQPNLKSVANIANLVGSVYYLKWSYVVAAGAVELMLEESHKLCAVMRFDGFGLHI